MTGGLPADAFCCVMSIKQSTCQNICLNTQSLTYTNHENAWIVYFVLFDNQYMAKVFSLFFFWIKKKQKVLFTMNNASFLTLFLQSKSKTGFQTDINLPDEHVYCSTRWWYLFWFQQYIYRLFINVHWVHWAWGVDINGGGRGDLQGPATSYNWSWQGNLVLTCNE